MNKKFTTLNTENNFEMIDDEQAILEVLYQVDT